MFKLFKSVAVLDFTKQAYSSLSWWSWEKWARLVLYSLCCCGRVDALLLPDYLSSVEKTWACLKPSLRLWIEILLKKERPLSVLTNTIAQGMRHGAKFSHAQSFYSLKSRLCATVYLHCMTKWNSLKSQRTTTWLSCAKWHTGWTETFVQ